MVILFSCKSSKTVYDDGRITDRKFEKLIKDFNSNPRDTALANQVKYAYDQILAGHLNEVSRWQYTNQLNDKERLLTAYQDLQRFYDNIRNNPNLNNLLRPSSVAAEVEKTRLDLVSGYYEEALSLLQENNWRSARIAFGSLTKVERWMPNYKDTRRLTREARESSILEAIVLPLRAEGFFYNPGNQNFGGGPRLAEQLVRDLGGSFNQSGWYRVYEPWQANRIQGGPDATLDPVWVQLQTDAPRTQQTRREVSKQIEVGRDTSNRPVYQTVRATLNISEQSANASGRLEMRMTDERTRELLWRNSWNETHSHRNRWATYTGDSRALSNDDWDLVNADRGQPISNAWLEEQLIRKMYQNILNDLRNRLNNASF
jgi:hypothetical protein